MMAFGTVVKVTPCLFSKIAWFLWKDTKNNIKVMRKKSGIVMLFMLLLSMGPFISLGQIPPQIVSGLKAGDA